ncbi:MAG TPA: MFS transporter [Mycobacteriales bacterium]|nr:MFS transporter [Mycobacteriales bacterium]
MSPRTERPWLTRNLAVLSGVSLLQDSASELLYPVLPVFLTVVLGAPPAVVGLVEGLAEGGAAGARLVAGRLADRFARRPLVAAGYGLAALGKVLVAAATGWPVVLAGRVVDRVGKGLRRTPRDALLADGVAPSEFGRVYGFHRSADTLGAVIGPLLGLAAYAALGHRIRPLLWVAVVPAVASVLLVFAVREARPAAPGPAHPDAPVDLARLPPTYWARRRPAHGLRPVNFPDALLLLLRAGELGLSVGAVILVYVAFNVSYAALSFPAGALADRWPRARVFAIGLGCFAVGYLGLGLVGSPAWVWVLLPVYGGFAACTDAVGKAWISALAPVGRRGSAQGVFQGLGGLAVLAAGLWAGLLWSAGPGAGVVPLLVSGSVGALAAGVLLAAGRGLEPPLGAPGRGSRRAR